MADFTETVKEHIGNMTPEELAATESRRLSRDAAEPLVLEARWDKPGPRAAGEPAILKQIAVQVGPGDPIASGGGILNFSGQDGFQETLILTSSAHRLIAGGINPAATIAGLEGRFVIRAGGNESDWVSADRAALATIMERERPVETARAMRLVALEPTDPAPGAVAALVKLFASRWDIDIIHGAVEHMIAKVPSRILHRIAGKDHVSLSVRKEELTVGDGGFFQSPLAASIVRPPGQPLPAAIVILGDPEAYRQRDVPFLQNTFGEGALRRLVLDAAKLKDVIATLEPEARERALQLLGRLVARAAGLNLKHPRQRTPLRPVMAGPREPGILPAPVPRVEGVVMAERATAGANAEEELDIAPAEDSRAISEDAPERTANELDEETGDTTGFGVEEELAGG